MRPAEIDARVDEAEAAIAAGDAAAAWAALDALAEGAQDDPRPARALSLLLRREELDRERRVLTATALLDGWPDDPWVLCAIGRATEGLHDLRYLNAAPPAAPLFDRLARRLAALLDESPGGDARAAAASALATAARIAGRRHDEACERAHRTLLSLRPDRWEDAYDYGLFLKVRGRFAEALAENRRARDQGGGDDEGVAWNLGICATGAGDGAAALEAWRGIGLDLEPGPGGLPTGPFAMVQVRLAERPLACRDAEHDDPGLEETIWIERLSPCHGRIRSALLQDLGVDYGDLVLFDGAPIVTRSWGERSVPVFPHLATLAPGGWSIFPFAGTQREPGQVAALDDALPGEATIYVHTEQVRDVCRACWEDEAHDHLHEGEARRVVTGKVCAPPGADLAALAAALDAAPDGVTLAAPALRAALDDRARETEDRARYDLLRSAGEG